MDLLHRFFFCFLFRFQFDVCSIVVIGSFWILFIDSELSALLKVLFVLMLTYRCLCCSLFLMFFVMAVIFVHFGLFILFGLVFGALVYLCVVVIVFLQVLFGFVLVVCCLCFFFVFVPVDVLAFLLFLYLWLFLVLCFFLLYLFLCIGFWGWECFYWIGLCVYLHGEISAVLNYFVFSLVRFH